MKRRLRALFRMRNRYLLGLDLVVLVLSPRLALLLRTENFGYFEAFSSVILAFTVSSVALKILVFSLSGLYSEYWSYASVHELETLLRSTAFSFLGVAILFFAVLMPAGLVPRGFPRSLPLIDGFLTLLFIGGIRLSIRLVYSVYYTTHDRKDLKPALIAGAGVAGAMVAKELRTNPQLGFVPVGFVGPAASD